LKDAKNDFICNNYNNYDNDDGLYNDTAIFEQITVDNGSVMIADKRGKSRCEFLQKNGERLSVTLEDVK
jgi:hypothetical protein